MIGRQQVEGLGGAIVPPRLSFRAAQLECWRLGFSLRRTGCDGEVRLCQHGLSENAAYYTDDLDDAVATARAEAGLRAASRRIGAGEGLLDPDFDAEDC